MSLLGRLLSRITAPVPIRHSHTYRCVITDELFVIQSVGRQVSIQRMDAERRPSTSVKKETMRRAIRDGMVVHEEQYCDECGR